MSRQPVGRRKFFARVAGCTSSEQIMPAGRIALPGTKTDRAILGLAGWMIAVFILLSCSPTTPAAERQKAMSPIIDAKAALMGATIPYREGDEKGSGREANTARSTNTYYLRPRDVVLFLGNSITELAKPEMEFLRADLRKQYSTLAEGDGEVALVLAGRSGEQAYQGAERVKALIDQHKPKVCVVCYGTCEVTFNNQESFLPAMRNITRQLKDAGAAVTIVSPPPPSATNWKQDGQWPASQFVDGLPRMVAKARALAEEEGLLFVDAFSALTAYAQESGREFTTDGIHLNANGYRVMADALQKSWGFGKPAQAIAKFLPEPQVVVESVYNGRRLVQYGHESMNDWGYAKPQSDVFWLALPRKQMKNPPLCVVLHSAGGGGQEPFQPICAPQYARGLYGDETYYILSLDCEKNRNDWWWGFESIKRNPELYKDELCPTEKRALSTIEWVINEFGIDRNRVYLNGISMGGSGSLGIGLNHGDLFAAVSVIVPAGIEHMKYRNVGPLPDRPPLINISSHLDTYAAGQEELLKQCADGRYAITFAWGPFGHSSVAINAANPSVYEYPWLSIRKNEVYPVFTHATTDNPYPGLMNRAGPDQNGQINGYFRWKNIEDTEGKFVMELRLIRKEELQRPVDIPREAVAEISLRRLQRFPVSSGAAYRWTMSTGETILQSGKVTATSSGILSIPALKISDSPTFLKIVADR
jgi:lysophospholipase L1-like esterase